MTAGPTGQQAILEGQAFEFSGTPLYYEDLAFAVAEGETDWVALLNYAVDDHARGRLADRDVQDVVQRSRPDRAGVGGSDLAGCTSTAGVVSIAAGGSVRAPRREPD